jgi:hypothetical protein
MEPGSLSLRNGETDCLGNKVSRVFSRDPVKRYVIWETDAGNVVCDADDETVIAQPTVSEWTIKVAGLLSNQAAFKKHYNSYVAHAYKLCFDGDLQAALLTLKTTYDEIVRRLQRAAKLAFLLGALGAAMTCVVTCATLYLHHFGNDTLDLIFAAVGVSALGGFMSVASGLRKIAIDLEERTRINVLYGALRVVVAMIAGLVATLLIRTGAVLSFLQKKDAFSGFLLVCFLSGFSERFVYKALKTSSDKRSVKAVRQGVSCLQVQSGPRSFHYSSAMEGWLVILPQLHETMFADLLQSLLGSSKSGS